MKLTFETDLKKDIKKLQENNSKLNDELSKLQRIIKNSKDEPTFILDGSWEYNHSLWAGLCREYIHKICLYINKEEYLGILEIKKIAIIDNYNGLFFKNKKYCKNYKYKSNKVIPFKLFF